MATSNEKSKSPRVGVAKGNSIGAARQSRLKDMLNHKDASLLLPLISQQFKGSTKKAFEAKGRSINLGQQATPTSDGYNIDLQHTAGLSNNSKYNRNRSYIKNYLNSKSLEQ